MSKPTLEELRNRQERQETRRSRDRTMPDRRPTLEAEQIEWILCSCQRRFIPPGALVCELCREEA